MSNEKIVKDILKAFIKWKPYVYKKAVSGSIYIKFPHWGLGSIRIGNHSGIQKYTYRWRIRLEKRNYVHQDIHRDISFMEVSLDQLTILIAEFERQANDRGIKPGDISVWHH